MIEWGSFLFFFLILEIYFILIYLCAIHKYYFDNMYAFLAYYDVAVNC